MARVITPAEMGVIAGIILLASLIQIIVNLGLNSSIAKFISENIGKGADYSKYVISSLALRIPLTLAITSQIAIFSTYLSITLFNTPKYSNILSLAAIDIALLSINPLLNNTLLGSGKLKEMALYGVSSVLIRWASITAFLYKGFGLAGVVYGWITGDSALLIMLTLSTFKRINLQKNLLSQSIALLPSMLKFSWPIYIGSITTFLYTWYDKALILAFLPLEQLGIYNIAYMAFSVLASIAASLGSSLLPYYGIMYGKNNHKAISEGIKRASKYTMLIMFPLALGLAATAKPVITLFAGQQYESGWPVLATLAIFGLVYGLSPAFSNLLLIYGKTKTILLLNLISVASSLTLLPLILLLNLTGLAIMKGASLLITSILSIYYISKIVKIEVNTSTATKTLISSLTMAIIVLATQQLLQNKLLLPVHVLIGAITYTSIIRRMKVLDEEDVQLIKGIFGEKITRNIAKIMNIQ